ncbi:hypothetical protein [Deferrisoma camini]|uniref:hypothetical protein n=1 Tax=Deferrisoma camini TaxID=1035120 RepID=UPI00046CBB1E|nr:hypothetical protein [Deferrisoma camini]
MPITFKKTVAVLEGVCAVEDAEGLLAWLQSHPRGKVNLKRVEHLHTAVLQVLMAASPAISAWPEDPDLAQWLRCVGSPGGT